MAKKLTPVKVAGLRPTAARYETSDGGTGLYVETRPTGGQSYVSRYQWAGKPAKLVLGPVLAQDPRRKIHIALGVTPTIGSPLSLEEARWLNALVRRQVASGVNPKGQTRKHADAGFTVRSVGEEYLKRHGHLRSLRGRRYDLGLINAALGSCPIIDVKISDLVRLGDKIEEKHGAAAADRVRATWQTLANWHAGRVDDFRPPGARRGAKRNKTEPRARVLSDDETRRVWAAAGALRGPFGRFVQFVLLTATRRNEAAGMRRSELVDESTWVIPSSRYKTKRELLVPLSAAAQTIIRSMPMIGDGDLVFTNDGRRAIGNFVEPKRLLEQASGVTGWRLHDLRRTARTLLSRAGVDADIAERCLGHAIGGVRATYDRHEYESEKRHAFEALAAQIERIVNPPQANVVATHAMTGKHAHTDASVSVPEWIPLLKAYAHVTRVVRASASADVEIRQALDDGRLRHRVGLAYDGFPQRREIVNTTAPDGFWRSAQTHWADDRAVRSSPRFDARRVVVAQQDLFTLWPDGSLISEASNSSPKSGRTRKYDREEILITASEYVYDYGLPENQSKLIEKVYERLGNYAPADTLMKEVIGRFYKRMKAVDARR